MRFRIAPPCYLAHMLFWVVTAAAYGASPATAVPVAPAESVYDRVPEPSTAQAGAVSARVAHETVVVDGVVVDGQARALSWAIPAGADRLAVRADGWVGFVAPLSGWPAVFVSPPGGPAVALTNEGLVAVPGKAPVGFVEPPRAEGGLRFEGDALVWSTEKGPVRRTWTP
jgi:hypothetical protein